MKLVKLLVLLCITSSAYCINLGQVREQIRFEVHDTTTTTNNPRWDDRNLNTRINLKHKFVCNFTNCLFTRVLITPVTGQAEYTLPADLKTISRVSYQMINSTGSYRRLACKSLEGIDKDFPGGWEQISGYPDKYYKRGNVIGLQPKPSAVYAQVNGMRIDYWQRPYDLEVDTAAFFNGDTTLIGYEDAIIKGVVADLKKESGQDYATDLQEYNQWLNILKDMIPYEPDRSDSIKVNYNMGTNR